MRQARNDKVSAGKRPRLQTAHLRAEPSGRIELENRVEFDPDTFLNAVGVGGCVEYDVGEVIFHQGAPADAVFYVKTGEVQIALVSDHGKERVVALLVGGEFFGEGCLVGQPLYIAAATATKASTIAKIDKHLMTRRLRDEPALGQMFMSFLLSRKLQVEAELIDHLFNSSEKRLARLLLLLANIGKNAKMETIPEINQELLASRIGTNRSRINFFMNKFRRLGFIDYDGSGALHVHTSLLNVIAND